VNFEEPRVILHCRYFFGFSDTLVSSLGQDEIAWEPGEKLT